MMFTLLGQRGGMHRGTMAPLDEIASPANACFRIEFHGRWAGQNVPTGPLNNDIVKFRDLMVNLKAFGNRKKRNNFAPILS
jgi:hypothetical protein